MSKLPAHFLKMSLINRTIKPIVCKYNKILLLNKVKNPLAFAKEYKHGKQTKNPSMGPNLGGPFLLALFGFKKSSDNEKKAAKPEDDIIHLIKLAKLSEMKNEVQEADQFYHKALATVLQHEQIKDMSDAEIANAKIHIYDNMANLVFSQGQFDKAEKLFKETMRGLVDKGTEKTDNSIVEISLKLAMIYAMKDQIENAEKGYIFCLETQEAKLETMTEPDDDTVALYGMCTNSYSRFLMVLGRLDEAEQQMKKCVNLAIKTFGEDHPQVAVLLNDLATLESKRNKFDDAAKNLDRAIVIAKKTQSPDLPAIYCNLGQLYIHKGDNKQANKLCHMAKKLAKRLGDADVEEKAQTCLNYSSKS